MKKLIMLMAVLMLSVFLVGCGVCPEIPEYECPDVTVDCPVCPDCICPSCPDCICPECEECEECPEVPPVNQAPIITSTPISNATWRIKYIYDVEANDPDGDILTYSLNVSSIGMAIDPSTGVIEWVPSLDQVELSPHDVTVEVSDGELRAIQSFVIFVTSQ